MEMDKSPPSSEKGDVPMEENKEAALDQVLPAVVLSEIASKLPPFDFANFRRVSKNCLRACEARTNSVLKFDFECTKYNKTEIEDERRGTPDERIYYLDKTGHILLAKLYDDCRKSTVKSFAIKRGVAHFFNRICNKRPQHVQFNITTKFVGADVSQRVYDAIQDLYRRGTQVIVRKLTLTVDTVQRFHLLTGIFKAAEYDIHGCATADIHIDDVGYNVRNCPLNVHIDQFSVDIRQLTAKHLYLWDVTLDLADFVDYLRTRTKMKAGLVMQFHVLHEEDIILDDLITKERKRLNPVGTRMMEYTVFLSKLRSSTGQRNTDGTKYQTTVQLRWHVINTKAPWLSSRQTV